jgi:WD40 repeat protein
LWREDKYATIYSITFEPKGRLIAVSSDSHKIHIFKVNLFDDELNKLKENDD